MTAQEFINRETKRRFDLVENADFRKMCIEACKVLGITAEEWNKNRAGICLLFANEICAKQNKENKNNRGI